MKKSRIQHKIRTLQESIAKMDAQCQRLQRAMYEGKILKEDAEDIEADDKKWDDFMMDMPETFDNAESDVELDDIEEGACLDETFEYDDFDDDFSDDFDDDTAFVTDVIDFDDVKRAKRAFNRDLQKEYREKHVDFMDDNNDIYYGNDEGIDGMIDGEDGLMYESVGRERFNRLKSLALKSRRK